MTALQGSLFELDAAPGLGPLADLVVRHQLGRGAWVDLLPGWLGCADEVYDRLLDWTGRQSDGRCTSGWSRCRVCSGSTARTRRSPTRP